MHLSSKWLFLQKSSTHENLSSALQKNCSFHYKETLFMHLSFALKLPLATFSHWERIFEHLWPRILIICLVCTKNQNWLFLEALRSDFVHLSSKMTFSAKKLKHMKICLLHCKKAVHSLEKTFFMYLSFALKLHLATVSHWERCFWASVASHSHNLLSCTKTQNWCS